MVIEGEQSLGGEYTMEYTDVLQSCAPEIYINQFYTNRFNFKISTFLKIKNTFIFEYLLTSYELSTFLHYFT